MFTTIVLSTDFNIHKMDHFLEIMDLAKRRGRKLEEKDSHGRDGQIINNHL